MYDYAKAKFEDFPPRYLTEHIKVRTGRSLFDKYATDVYYIYAFGEGTV
jgi:hypothetical protein